MGGSGSCEECVKQAGAVHCKYACVEKVQAVEEKGKVREFFIQPLLPHTTSAFLIGSRGVRDVFQRKAPQRSIIKPSIREPRRT